VVQLSYYIDDDMGVDKGKNLHSLTTFIRP
jgi:hypothetical protein